MTNAYSTSSYASANTQPTASAGELRLWWYRNTVSPRYYPYKVKVEERQKWGNLDILTFRLARDESLGPFQVDLAMQHEHVWPDLPSTAQRVVTGEDPTGNPPRLYGFLMLSEAWENSANAQLSPLPTGFSVTNYREGEEKWPFSARFEPARSTEPQADSRQMAWVSGLLDSMNRSVA